MRYAAQLILCCLCIFSTKLFAQEADSLHSDCQSAYKITFVKPVITLKKKVPLVGGKLQEISGSGKGRLVFEKEHRTAWYLITMANDGEFSFEVSPDDSLSNDYDFVLYKYTDSSFCQAFKGKPELLVRSNISRNKPELKGKTGLKKDAVKEFENEGIGEAYSKILPVKKGEKYMLVLDNVSKNAKAYTLQLRNPAAKVAAATPQLPAKKEIPKVYTEVHLSGQVKDDSGATVPALITISDGKGNSIKKLQADGNGSFDFKISIENLRDYTISIEHEGKFSSVKTLNTKNIDSNHVRINEVLPKLVKGKNYSFGAINFYGSSPQTLPSANSSLKALHKLMLANPQMKIEIEGHVNNPQPFGSKLPAPNPTGYQILSENRAKTVYDYLIEKGIDKSRCSTIGYGCKKMLFPYATSAKDQEANRRVEIRILEL